MLAEELASNSSATPQHEKASNIILHRFACSLPTFKAS
jgi:hypothetical protein